MSSNANRNTAVHRDDYIEVQKHEKPPVHILIDYDLTASREPTRDRHVAEFKNQMAGLKDAIGMNPEDKLLISLAVHNGDGGRLIGSYTDPVEVGKALERILCVSGRTHIVRSMNVAMMKLDREGRKPDAIIHIGDTTDGDITGTMVTAAQHYGIPVITLLERTINSSGTKEEHVRAMAAMSEASGIVGCPLPYSSEIKFADMFLVIAATIKYKNNPNRMQKVLAGVSQTVRDIFSNRIRESIARPHTVSNDGRPSLFTRISNSPHTKRGSKALNILALAGLAALVLCMKNCSNTDDTPATTVAQPVEPEKNILKGDVVIVDERSKVLFDTGKASLTPSFKVFLDGLAQKVQENPGKCIQLYVNGHTDVRGNDALNLKLSQDRAAAVGYYLNSKGISPNQITTAGFGKSQPLVSVRPGMTAAEIDQTHSTNRRATFRCEQQ